MLDGLPKHTVRDPLFLSDHYQLFLTKRNYDVCDVGHASFFMKNHGYSYLYSSHRLTLAPVLVILITEIVTIKVVSYGNVI